MRAHGWLERYLAGAHERVWDEMVACGAAIRDDALVLAEVESVARETMRRVRKNAERLERSLRRSGYEFSAERSGETWPREVLQPVDPDAQGKLDRIQERVGPMPLSVKAFFLEVGCIAFNGRLPGWTVRYADPLEVCTVLDGLDDLLVDMVDQGLVAHLELSADYLHKAGISGGAAYGVLLPNPCADAPWEYDDLHPDIGFVGYLRSVFADGGLPGWRRTRGDQPPPNIGALTADLIAF
jgi:hypothetical protein